MAGCVEKSRVEFNVVLEFCVCMSRAQSAFLRRTAEKNIFEKFLHLSLLLSSNMHQFSFESDLITFRMLYLGGVGQSLSLRPCSVKIVSRKYFFEIFCPKYFKRIKTIYHKIQRSVYAKMVVI